ncbi:hypothetical protein ABK040_008447 [Willaertia magna]
MLFNELPPEIIGTIYSYLSTNDIIKFIKYLNRNNEVCKEITYLNISQLIGFVQENKYTTFPQTELKKATFMKTIKFIAKYFPNLETITLDCDASIYKDIKSYSNIENIEKDINNKEYKIFNLILHNLKHIKHLYFHYECYQFGPNLAYHYRNQLETLTLPLSYFLSNESILFHNVYFPKLRKLFIEDNENHSFYNYNKSDAYQSDKFNFQKNIFNFLFKIINQLTHLRFDFLFNIFKEKHERDKICKLFTKENKLISFETYFTEFSFWLSDEVDVLPQEIVDNLFKLKQLTFTGASSPICHQITEKSFPNLEILDLSHSEQSRVLEYSYLLISHTKLKHLIIQSLHTDQLILNCPNLEVLDIKFSDFYNIQFKSIHYKLYNIDFNNCKYLTDLGLQSILQNCPLITGLNSIGCKNIKNIFNFSNLKYLQKLKCESPKQFDKYLLFNIFNTCPLLSKFTTCGLTILENEFNEFSTKDENKFFNIEWKSLQCLRFINCNLNSNFISYILNKAKNIYKLYLFNVELNDNLFKIKSNSLKCLYLHSLQNLTNDCLNETIKNLPNLQSLNILYCNSITKLVNLGKKLTTLELALNTIELPNKVDNLRELTLNHIEQLYLNNNFKVPNIRSLRIISCDCLNSKDLNSTLFNLIMNSNNLSTLFIDSCDWLLEFNIPNQISFLEIVNCIFLSTVQWFSETRLQEIIVKNCQSLKVEQLKTDLKLMKPNIYSSIIYCGHKQQQEKPIHNKNCNIQ